jgi:hypothetical protein
MKQYKTVTLKDGKEYVKVAERIKEYKKEYPHHRISTKIISTSATGLIMKATLRDHAGNVIRTAHAGESFGKSEINQFSIVENCETSAIGRALGFYDIGLLEDIATADDMVNVDRKDGEAKAETMQKVSDHITNKVANKAEEHYDRSKDKTTAKIQVDPEPQEEAKAIPTPTAFPKPEPTIHEEERPKTGVEIGIERMRAATSREEAVAAYNAAPASVQASPEYLAVVKEVNAKYPKPQATAPTPQPQAPVQAAGELKMAGPGEYASGRGPGMLYSEADLITMGTNTKIYDILNSYHIDITRFTVPTKNTNKKIRTLILQAQAGQLLNTGNAGEEEAPAVGNVIPVQQPAAQIAPVMSEQPVIAPGAPVVQAAGAGEVVVNGATIPPIGADGQRSFSDTKHVMTKVFGEEWTNQRVIDRMQQLAMTEYDDKEELSCRGSVEDIRKVLGK